jgi:hypothetical protein
MSHMDKGEVRRILWWRNGWKQTIWKNNVKLNNILNYILNYILKKSVGQEWNILIKIRTR